MIHTASGILSGMVVVIAASVLECARSSAMLTITRIEMATGKICRVVSFMVGYVLRGRLVSRWPPSITHLGRADNGETAPAVMVGA